MGCASSKQKRCSHCNSPYSPMPRSYSMHVHHPPQSKGDSYHVVALTSTTLGSLDQLSNKIAAGNGFRFTNGKVSDGDGDSDRFIFGNGNSTQNHEEKSDDACSKEFSNGLVEAKTWSNMIEQKLPKAMFPRTPTTTPPCEPETINTWELMEGLEDTTSPLRSPNHFRSFTFDVNVNNGHVDPPKSCLIENNGNASSPKPMWLQMTQEEAEPNLKPEISDCGDDPQVVSSFQKSLQEEQESIMARNGSSFEEKKISDDDVVMDFKPTSCGKKDKVVFYFTSLRGVRKTYEDCCHVRLILKGLGVRVDERDVSMHSGFKEELKELLGNGFGKGALPRVFVGRNYIGGAEEIQRMHEDGKLEKLLECCEKIDDNGDAGGTCEACGDIRFVPCETCHGSCKIYYEGYDDEEQEEQEDGEVGEYGFQRCPDCNENGLIRCPICCY